MSKETGGPAFPLPLGTMNCAEPDQSGGMTLRDYFAAKAIAGAMESLPQCHDDTTAMKMTAAIAYGIADAMLAERDK